MGKFSKSKGYRVEHKLVKEFNIEIKDERFHKLSVEVKARKNGDGFKTLEKWKSGADLLCLHKDHGTTMVCLDLPLFIDILKQDEL
jgi:hypothetical protein